MVWLRNSIADHVYSLHNRKVIRVKIRSTPTKLSSYQHQKNCQNFPLKNFSIQISFKISLLVRLNRNCTGPIQLNLLYNTGDENVARQRVFSDLQHNLTMANA